MAGEWGASGPASQRWHFRPGRTLAGPLLALFIAALLMGGLAACRRSEPATPAVVFTPIVGGLRLPTATPVDVAALDATETPPPATETPPPATETPPASRSTWLPGQSVAVQEEALLHAQPDPTAQVLERYGAGTIFEIVEPSGDYDQYPVEGGGVRFIRVRTDDGLVGWVDVEATAPAEVPTP